MSDVTLVYKDGDNIIEVSKQNKSLTPYSRYRSLLQLTTPAQQTYLQTFQLFTIPQTPQDQFHYVETAEENRIDLIAYRYYKLPQLWWVIAMANSITNPLSLPVATQLRIPSSQALYQFGGILS